MIKPTGIHGTRFFHSCKLNCIERVLDTIVSPLNCTGLSQSSHGRHHFSLDCLCQVFPFPAKSWQCLLLVLSESKKQQSIHVYTYSGNILIFVGRAQPTAPLLLLTLNICDPHSTMKEMAWLSLGEITCNSSGGIYNPKKYRMKPFIYRHQFTELNNKQLIFHLPTGREDPM